MRAPRSMLRARSMLASALTPRPARVRKAGPAAGRSPACPLRVLSLRRLARNNGSRCRAAIPAGPLLLLLHALTSALPP